MARQKRIVDESPLRRASELDRTSPLHRASRDIKIKPAFVKSNKHKVVAGIFLFGFIALAFVFFFFSEKFTGFFLAVDEEIRYKISIFVIAVFLLFVIMIAFILYWYIKLSSFVMK